MQLRILNNLGDLVLTDAQTTEGIENVKQMTTQEIETAFNRLVEEGYTPINDKTKKIMKRFSPAVEEVTILYPVVGG